MHIIPHYLLPTVLFTYVHTRERNYNCLRRVITNVNREPAKMTIVRASQVTHRQSCNPPSIKGGRNQTDCTPVSLIPSEYTPKLNTKKQNSYRALFPKPNPACITVIWGIFQCPKKLEKKVLQKSVHAVRLRWYFLEVITSALLSLTVRAKQIVEAYL